MNEADTRAELIEPQLKIAGWGEVAESRIQREYNINTGEISEGGIRYRSMKADYVLIYKNRKLAVIEAKSNQVEVSEGVAQAKQYATKLELTYTYSANGKEIYEICLAKDAENECLVDRFPTPDELWNRIFGNSNEWQAKFNAIPFENTSTNKQERYYQEIAVNKVMDAIAHHKIRILITLATGTGKTFVAFQIAWKLCQTRWNLQKNGKRTPRILFLTDRNILVNQAYLAFNRFGDDALVRIRPDQIDKRGEVPKNGSIFFTIFQTLMSGSKCYFEEYEPDFFDFIIIDECHRGGADNESKWRDILNYFKQAVQLGLTATPKRTENADTYQYFGEPVYKYSLKEGIQDGFLTPFKVRRIQTTIDEYIYAADDDVLEGEVQEDRRYIEKDFNKNIIIQARERLRVQEMLKNINQNEKTLVFCANQEHAAMVRDLINQEVKKNDYCVRVTSNDGKIGETDLKSFQDNDKTLPTIITTSRKLTTGVDALNVRNIVLMRPVNSMIEFKQIIGRGTRLFDGKQYFTIIDFVKSYQLFNDPEWDGEPIDQETKELNSECQKDIDTDNRIKDIHNCDDEKEKKTKVKIRLSDGREIEIMSITMYFNYDGKLISEEEFIQRIFDTLKLPSLFGTEEKLHQLWANPITRSELLQKLEDHSFPKSDLVKLQTMIQAEKCDLLDVLEYIIYGHQLIERTTRVKKADVNIYTFLNEQQKEFISFVLQNYIQDGVDELDINNLDSTVKSKYGGSFEAEKALGEPKEIRRIFIDFQQYLYTKKVA